MESCHSGIQMQRKPILSAKREAQHPVVAQHLPCQDSQMQREMNTSSGPEEQQGCVHLKTEDSVDVMKAEKEMFSSEEEDDVAAIAVKQAMEAVSKAMGPKTDLLPSAEALDFRNSNAQLQSQAVHPGNHAPSNRTKRMPQRNGLRQKNEKSPVKRTMNANRTGHHPGPCHDDGEVLQVKKTKLQPAASEDNEALMDLHVQFQQWAAPTTRAKTAIRKQRKLKSKTPSAKRRGKKPPVVKRTQQVHQLLHLKLTVDAFDRWRQIGTMKGLPTDMAIAVFLVQFYEKNQERHCPGCESPLILYCLKCRPSLSTENSAEHATDASPGGVSYTNDDHYDSHDAEEMDESALLKTEAAESSSPKRQKLGGGRDPYTCTECGSVFSRSGGLKVHMRLHTGEKPYKCDQCGEAFSQSGQLTVHIRKHTGERPFVCAECGSSFPLSGSLKQHMRIHTGEKPFSCPHCDKQFSYAGDLTVHLRKHSGDKPFLCQDCGKAFAVSSDLTKHKKIHSGDKPYACVQCGKAFPFLNRLTAHMRTHTGDKPFLCQECGAAFSRASNLTVHKRVHHTFEKPFKCPECDLAFSDSANLSKHKKNKHRKEKKIVATGSKQQGSPASVLRAEVQTSSTSDVIMPPTVTSSSSPSVFPYYSYYYYQHQQQAHQFMEPSTG